MIKMFKSEGELVKSIHSFAETNPTSLIAKGDISIFTELDLGYGIADLVVVGYQKNLKPKRARLLSSLDLNILTIIEKHQTITLDMLMDITRASKASISSSIQVLLKENLISSKNNCYSADKDYITVLNDTVAIEAKLRNWKRALQQAHRYKWFSDRSFVFIPMENIAAPRDNIKIFHKYNIGLAGVQKDNEVHIFYSPKKEVPISKTMHLKLNEHLLFT